MAGEVKGEPGGGGGGGGGGWSELGIGLDEAGAGI
jgi:hypothetical protein